MVNQLNKLSETNKLTSNPHPGLSGTTIKINGIVSVHYMATHCHSYLTESRIKTDYKCEKSKLIMPLVILAVAFLLLGGANAQQQQAQDEGRWSTSYFWLSVQYIIYIDLQISKTTLVVKSLSPSFSHSRERSSLFRNSSTTGRTLPSIF